MTKEQALALKENFISDTEVVENPQVLVVAVKLPTGAIEIIQNTQQLESKIRYYKEAYNDEFRLINNPDVQVVGYMIV